ncbi:Hypothetical predicted protein, partial [Marmota monax]
KHQQTSQPTIHPAHPRAMADNRSSVGTLAHEERKLPIRPRNKPIFRVPSCYVIRTTLGGKASSVCRSTHPPPSGKTEFPPKKCLAYTAAQHQGGEMPPNQMPETTEHEHHQGQSSWLVWDKPDLQFFL